MGSPDLDHAVHGRAAAEAEQPLGPDGHDAQLGVHNHPPARLASALAIAIAGVVCFGLGWLGYRLISTEEPQDSGSTRTPLAQSAVEPQKGDLGSGARGTAIANPAPATSPRPGGNPTAAGVNRADSAPAVSLRCLAGGQAEQPVLADPSNYGPRLAQDWQGRPVPHQPLLIVLHETVVDEATSLNLFRRPHSDDGQQASYHVLIGRDGHRIRVVPDEQRAFGAGDSDYQGQAVQLKPGLKPSVNNIALHVSLVSPSDGVDGEGRSHSGYTAAQYRSLAQQLAIWQASYRIPATSVVTHQEVDRSGSRRDPRSFDWTSLSGELSSLWQSCGGSARFADLGRGGSSGVSR